MGNRLVFSFYKEKTVNVTEIAFTEATFPRNNVKAVNITVTLKAHTFANFN